MKFKPISASEALRGRQLLPSSNHNRFSIFTPRDSSALSSRERSSSTKRKASEDGQSASQPQGKKKPQVTNPPAGTVDLSKLESMNKKIGSLYNISAKLNDEVAKTKVSPELESVLRMLCEFMNSSISLQEELVNSLTVSTAPAGLAPKVTIEDVTDVSDSDMDTGAFSYSQVASRRPLRQKQLHQLKTPATPVPVADPKVKKFQDAVKMAEKSTLVFNLDMGNTKLLNEKSILAKATLALTAKAAEVEGKPLNKLSQNSVDALDDVLSIAEGVTLFGKQTKPFRNPKMPEDPKNGTFFTIPVRYEFKDKEQRFSAESVLRDRCKVECTTPYPVILRHCIKQVVDHVRALWPGEFVKVQVDPTNFCLKVSRRLADKKTWFKFDDTIPLPEEAYNTTARSVPDGLVMNNLPVRALRISLSAGSGSGSESAG